MSPTISVKRCLTCTIYGQAISLIWLRKWAPGANWLTRHFADLSHIPLPPFPCATAFSTLPLPFALRVGWVKRRTSRRLGGRRRREARVYLLSLCLEQCPQWCLCFFCDSLSHPASLLFEVPGPTGQPLPCFSNSFCWFTLVHGH